MRTDPKRLLFPLGLFGAGIYVLFCSVQYGIGSILKPGAGYWPFVMGILQTLLGGLLVVDSVKFRGGRRTAGERLQPRQTLRIGLIAATLLLWVVVSAYVGWVPTTLVLVVFLSRLYGLRGWVMPILLSVLVTGACYFLFGVLFYVDLPRGSIEFWD